MSAGFLYAKFLFGLFFQFLKSGLKSVLLSKHSLYATIHIGCATSMSITECCFRKTVDMLIRNVVTANTVFHFLVFSPFVFQAVCITAIDPIT